MTSPTIAPIGSRLLVDELDGSSDGASEAGLSTPGASAGVSALSPGALAGPSIISPPGASIASGASAEVSVIPGEADTGAVDGAPSMPGGIMSSEIWSTEILYGIVITFLIKVEVCGAPWTSDPNNTGMPVS